MKPLEHELHVNKPIWDMAISPDDRWLVTRTPDGVVIWDLTAEDPEANPVELPKGQAVTAMAISPTGHWLVTGDNDGTTRRWDLTAKDPAANPKVFGFRNRMIYAVAIDRDNRLVVGCEDGTAELTWNVAEGEPRDNTVALEGPGGRVGAVAISLHDPWLAASGLGGALLWDMRSRHGYTLDKPVFLGGHEGEVRVMAISRDNHWLVTGGEDKTARLWDLTAKDPAAKPVVLGGHQERIWVVAISPRNRWLVTLDSEDRARLWDLTAEIRRLTPSSWLTAWGKRSRLWRSARMTTGLSPGATPECGSGLCGQAIRHR